jgi:hypothetical protein
MIDALPHLFDTDGLLAVNVQASLDIAIDEDATRGKYELRPVCVPLKGQTELSEE